MVLWLGLSVARQLQGRPGLAPGVQMLLNGHVQDDGDENNAGPAARCSRKVVRKLINAAPGRSFFPDLETQSKRFCHTALHIAECTLRCHGLR